MIPYFRKKKKTTTIRHVLSYFRGHRFESRDSGCTL